MIADDVLGPSDVDHSVDAVCLDGEDDLVVMRFGVAAAARMLWLDDGRLRFGCCCLAGRRSV